MIDNSVNEFDHLVLKILAAAKLLAVPEPFFSALSGQARFFRSPLLLQMEQRQDDDNADSNNDED